MPKDVYLYYYKNDKRLTKKFKSFKAAFDWASKKGLLDFELQGYRYIKI